MERPPKRPKVLSKACELCKARRVKCNSTRPRCANCEKRGADCVYGEKGQPGLRPGYGKAIEDRLKQLEDTMQKYSKSIESILGSDLQSFGSISNDRTLENGSTLPLAPGITEAATPGFRGAATIGALQIPPGPEPEANFHRAEDPGFYLPGITSDLPDDSLLDCDNTWPTTEPHEGIPDQIPIKELAEAFFEWVYPWASIFHRPTFMKNILSPSHALLQNALVVLSSRFTSLPRSQAPGQDLIRSARETIILKSTTSCSLVSTQALALLALDTIGDGPSSRTWSIMALLLAAVNQLGLTRDYSDEQSPLDYRLIQNEDVSDSLYSSYVEQEERRRLFWLVYTLDRFASLFNGSPCGVDSHQIKHRFPTDDQHWDQPSSASWFTAFTPPQKHRDREFGVRRMFIEAVGLLDRVHQFLLQPVNLSTESHLQEWQMRFRRFDLGLSTWARSLPLELTERPREYDPMWLLLFATFHTAVIRLHSIAAFPPTSLPQLKMSPTAVMRCQQTVSKLAGVATSLSPGEIIQAGPLYCFMLWVASRNLISLWAAGHTPSGSEVPKDLLDILGILRAASSHWKCADRYANLIQIAIDSKDHMDAAIRIEILKDQRRTTYGIHKFFAFSGANKSHQPVVPFSDWLDFPLPDDDMDMTLDTDWGIDMW